MAKQYHYVGDGAGIIGLPREVTREEAEALGVLDLLEQAIRDGKYVEAQIDAPKTTKKTKEVTNG